jgi:PPOX class probable F420-dependent enzyme
MLTHGQAALFLDTNHGAFASLRKDGTALVTPLWVDWDGANIVINTAMDRAKERHIRRDPRVSILVIDQHNVARYVSVTGKATIDAEGAEEHIDKMAKKYLGVDKYPESSRTPGERRILVRIKPEVVTHWNVE